MNGHLFYSLLFLYVFPIYPTILIALMMEITGPNPKQTYSRKERFELLGKGLIWFIWVPRNFKRIVAWWRAQKA